MPIETNCTGCGQRLRVAEEHRGKTARCPQCGTFWKVPDATEAPQPRPPSDGPTGAWPGQPAATPGQPAATPGQPAAGAAPWSPEPAPARQDQWQLRTLDGKVYGPIPRSELDAWVEQGRVTGTMSILAPGQHHWEPAAAFYPRLGAAASSNVTQSATAAADPSSLGQLMPHRGPLILTLGLLSLCCFVLGPIAWALGNQDLQAMQAGRMDQAGVAPTQAGLILGIIGTVLLGLVVISRLLN